MATISSRRVLTALLCAAMLGGNPLTYADHIQGGTNKTWKGSDSAPVRDVARAQNTTLRWRSPSAATTNPQAKTSELVEKQVDVAASSETQSTRKRTTRSRLEDHAKREAGHVAQTSATKPKDDPFADPFFEEESAGPRLATRPKRAEPLLSQPVRLQQPPEFDDELPDPQPSEFDDDLFPLQPMPDDQMLFDSEQPEREPAREDFDLSQGYEQGELPPCPSPNDVKQIREITTDISAQAGEFPPECPLGDVAYSPRMFMPITYTWKASALCYKPLYFQQAAVERYGHSWGPLLQPFVSGADFYARVFALPYMMGMDPPHECVYALGWYRPGSCAPQMIYPIPISLRGALLEAGVIIGAAAIIP